MLNPACAFLIVDEQGLDASVISGSKVIAITESNVQDRYPNVLNASLLLPPYESVSAELDGNIQAAESIYISYLNSKEPDTFLSAIFTALVKGISIGIFIPKEDLEMSFAHTLLSHLFNSYGLGVMTTSIPFSYNNLADAGNLAKMYYYDLVGPNDLFVMWPDRVELPPFIINKLIFELNPILDEYNIENYISYFSGLLARVKSAGNRMLINPIVRDTGG